MRIGVIVLVAALSVGCGTPSPTAPTTTAGSIDGTWSGTASDTSGPGTMTWRVASNGSSFAGTVIAVEGSTQVTGRGTVSGTTSGSGTDLSLTFSVTFPEGAFDRPYDGCAATITGSGRVTRAQLTGSYAGTNSCSGEVASGQLTLNRQ